MQLLSLNLGQPRLAMFNGQPYSTAIDKSPVQGLVELGPTGLAGDKQADTSVHGGPDKAVCCFPSEHFPFFARQLGAPVGPGAFGENFTLAGGLEDEVCIGDTYQAPRGIIVQVSQPRQPCAKLARKHNRPDMIPMVHQAGFCGFYFRTLTPGSVNAGDTLQLVARPNPRLSVRDTFWAKFTPDAPLELVKLLAGAEGLAEGWRDHFRGRVDM
jgi:MOSC domain-containing protein YiiM